MEGGMKCVKFLVFFFNFIFWLCGLALIVVGVLAQTAIANFTMIKQVATNASPIVIIVVGVVIFFIAFFGCCGAWKENYCMVTMFVVLLSFIIIVEIGIAIAAYVLRNQLTNLVDTGLKEAIKNYTNPDIKTEVDNLQKWLNCCGAVNSSDWVNFKPDKISVPDSCCKNVTDNCGIGAMTNATIINIQGCGEGLENFFKKNILWVGVAALVIAFIEILGVVFACALMRGIRKGYEVM
ncbi:CD63 antigen [Tachysurus fulvidraco]|uniref:CD63 antigen n=1 Tax=Tachysurus fulvidraco TaxID=1234273 RepID=UPI000F4FD770|nr:CD63 antigen [Tachysurus fulvidraco]